MTAKHTLLPRVHALGRIRVFTSHGCRPSTRCNLAPAQLFVRGACLPPVHGNWSPLNLESNSISSRCYYSTVVYRGQNTTVQYEFDESQVFGSEVKVNPTESEADVAADRGEKDPLPMGMHNTILLDAGEIPHWMRPTESEDAVHADRDTNDPMRRNTG